MQRLAFIFVFVCAACASSGASDVTGRPRVTSGSVEATGTSAPDEAARTKAFFEALGRFKSQVKAGVSPERLEQTAEKLVRAYPERGLAWFNLGVAKAKRGDEGGASAAFEKAVSRQPSLTEARENLLALRQGDDRPDAEVLAALRETVQADPRAARARVALAEYLVMRGSTAEAEAMAREALAMEPKNVRAYCVMALGAIERGKLRRANLVIAQGLRLNADAPCLQYAQGQRALRKKDPGAARVFLEKALKRDPSLHDARWQAARLALAAKDFRSAARLYQAAAQSDATRGAALVNLGVALKGAGQYEKARGAYEEALSAGASAEADFNLGVLYLRHLNQLDPAEKHLRRFVQNSDGDASEKAFKMLEEIEQRRAMLAEEARMAEEEAARAAQEKLEAEAAAKARAEEAARAKAAGEPTAPEAGAAPPAPEPPKVEAPKPKPKPRPKARTRRAPRPAKKRPPARTPPSDEPAPPPEDFE